MQPEGRDINKKVKEKHQPQEEPWYHANQTLDGSLPSTPCPDSITRPVVSPQSLWNLSMASPESIPNPLPGSECPLLSDCTISTLQGTPSPAVNPGTLSPMLSGHRHPSFKLELPFTWPCTPHCHCSCRNNPLLTSPTSPFRFLLRDEVRHSAFDTWVGDYFTSLPVLDWQLHEGRDRSIVLPALLNPSAQNNGCSQEHSGSE